LRLLDNEAAMSAAPWPLQAHFRAAVGMASVKLGRPAKGLPHLLRAAVQLKGYHPYMRVTIQNAIRSGKTDLIEKLLVRTAPFVHPSTWETAGIDATVRPLLDAPDGRSVLARVQNKVDPQSWLHGYIDRLIGPAGQLEAPILE
jgi:hypothetical protein